MRRHLTTLTLLLALAIPIHAQPMGGLSIHEVGGPDMGSSYAGAGARASDAATAWLNPAGLTRLDGIQILSGTGMNWVNLELELDAPGTVSVPPGSLDGGGHAGAFVPLVGAYSSVPLGERLRAGFAMLTPFGGMLDYDLNFVGRQVVSELTLFTLLLQPTAAFEVTDWLSVGAGLDILYGTLDQELLVNPLEAVPGAAFFEISDARDWTVGANVGILLQPWDGTRVGVTYVSEMELELEGQVENPTNRQANVGLDLTMPHSLNASLYQEITPELALLLDAGWSNWSDFGSVPITLGPIDRVQERDWHDTWRIGVGGQWQVTPEIRVRSGFSYDSASVDADGLLPDMPVGDTYRISVGGEYRPNEHVEIGLSYTAALMDLEVDHVALPPTGAVVLDGEYDPAAMHIFGISLNLGF